MQGEGFTMKRTIVATIMLVAVVCAAQPSQEKASVHANGAIWYDTAGHVINAHGGGVLPYGGRFYLYGEHKVYGVQGNRAHVGVHMYSSPDLIAWKD